MGKLHPLLARDIHQVNVAGAGFSWAILANPGKSEELSIRRPRRRYGITLVGHALDIRSIRLHGVDLRKPGSPAYPGDLRVRFRIPHRRYVAPGSVGDALQICP